MSTYITHTRTNNDIREVRVIADIHNKDGKVIGERQYGWHPEHHVTVNGVDVCEIWLAQRKKTLQFRDVLYTHSPASDGRFLGAS